jgi:hypothetical protein
MTTRRTALILAFGLPGFRLWAFGKEFWNEKKPEDWTPDEIELLLNKSPWSKEVAANLTNNGYGNGSPRSRNGGMGGIGGIGGMGGGGGMGGSGGRRGGTGGSSNPSGSSTPKGGMLNGVVRWESALPILAAQKKEAPPEMAEFHILSVNGVPMIGGRVQSSTASQTSDDPDQKALLEDRVKEGTKLVPHGKDPVFAAKVNLAQGERGTLIYFRRDAEPLTLERKEVAFELKLGSMEVKTKFNLKEMVYHGKLEV